MMEMKMCYKFVLRILAWYCTNITTVFNYCLALQYVCLYLGGALFKSRLWRRTYWLKFFQVFFSVFKKSSEYDLELGQNRLYFVSHFQGITTSHVCGLICFCPKVMGMILCTKAVSNGFRKLNICSTPTKFPRYPLQQSTCQGIGILCKLQKRVKACYSNISDLCKIKFPEYYKEEIRIWASELLFVQFRLRALACSSSKFVLKQWILREFHRN
jgi:hypothetical protein